MNRTSTNGFAWKKITITNGFTWTNGTSTNKFKIRFAKTDLIKMTGGITNRYNTR